MEAPTEEDCCHSDCKNCVLDIYQRKLKSNISQPPSQHIGRILSQTRYKAFELISVEVNTPSANVYTFGAENDTAGEVFFNPGEHIVIRNHPTDLESEHLSRPYTLIPWKNNKNTFSIVVKLYVNGKMSEVIRGWKRGEVVHCRGPYGDFIYEPNTYRKVFMICMGTGIAPMYALSKHITDDENDETFIRLMYGSSLPEEIILRKEISHLSGFWNFSCTHFISKGFKDHEKKFNETFVNGRIRGENVEHALNESDISKVLVLVCGTEEFNKQIEDALKMKLSEKHVHVFRA